MAIEVKHNPYSALQHRDFRLLLVAGMVSTIGAEMQTVAVGWELYDRTRDALALGLVGLVLVLPVIVLALPAGHLADLVSRKTIMMATQAVLALASLGLAWVSAAHGPIWLIYVCLAVCGTAMAFAFPARWAILPLVVPASDFSNAVTWRSSGWQSAAVIGPALGGLAFAAWERATPIYVIDAVLGVAVLFLIASIRGKPQSKSREPMTGGALLAGFRFVFATELVLAAITLDLFAVLLGGAVALLPIYAKDILQVGPAGLGWLRAAPSIGALAMAVTLAHRRPMRRAGMALLSSVVGFGLATIVFGVSKNFWLSLFMLLLTGAFDNISVVIRATLVQALTPDVLRGRVSSVNSVFISMSNELGGFESGVAARLLGPVTAVVAGGVGCLLVVAGVVWRWPQVARLGRLDRLSSSAERTSVELPDIPLEVSRAEP